MAHNQRFSVHLPCPYLKNNGKGYCTGETLADNMHLPVTISICCSKCGRVYHADLQTGKTYPATAQKRTGKH